MNDSNSLEHELSNALTEPHLVRARQSLNRVVERSNILLKSNSADELRRVCSLAYSHLASLADTASRRARYRALALKVCSDGLKVTPNSGTLASTYANAVVDWAYDPFAPTNRKLMLGNLSRSWRNCKKALDSGQTTETTVHLLVQWASVLRCQAHMFGTGGGKSFVERAERISESAVREDETSPLANLDLGLSLWALSRWAQSEDDFFSKVQRAEESLVRSHSMGLSLATLCLARLYRQTYRPVQALSWFEEFARREQKRRLVLAESHLVGESAVLLLHRDFDPQFLRNKLQTSEQLLTEAVQAGYKNARLLVSLARIRFSLGDKVGGIGFLQDIKRDGSTNWTLAVQEARNAINAADLDLLQGAFALGLNDGLVWNSLGTFTNDVMHDPEFSLQLYETGLQLNPYSAIIHTNIARLCLNSADQFKLPKAKNHLELASKHADFAFRWWKPLYETLNERLSGSPSLLKGYQVREESDSLDRIFMEFCHLEEAASAEANRGNRLEDIFLRTLKLSFGTDHVTGSLDLDGMQSDATFKHGAFYYRVEMSWDSRANDRSEIDKLIARLNRAQGTRGVLVSMSGFTDGVVHEVSRLRPQYIIFLIDRDEFRAVLKGEKRFESLIEEKEAQSFLQTA